MANLLSQVRGHDVPVNNVISTLKGHLDGRSLLFSGPSGIGKRLSALAVSQSLLCEEPKSPCGQCASCRKAEKNQHESLLIVEPESNSQIKVESSRTIIDFLNLRSLSPRRIVIINDAHKLNPQAANALLKTLETPPTGTVFLLIAPSPQSLLPTIRSRCQNIRFLPLSLDTLNEIQPSPSWILNASMGRLDRLEELSNSDSKEFRQRALRALLNAMEGRRYNSFALLKEIVTQREDAITLIRFWQQFLSDALKMQSKVSQIIHEDFRNELTPLCQIKSEYLFDFFENTKKMESEIQRFIDRNLSLEVFLLDIESAFSNGRER